MNHIFKIEHGFIVPDGTKVYPFLNPRDSMSGLPLDLLEGFSIAAGDIPPGGKSKIQVLPLVTQVTFVLRGTLKIGIREKDQAAPYWLTVNEEQAVLKKPGTFFQLTNPGEELCRVLYIISPAYVFDKPGEQILYDDALIYDGEWSNLAQAGWTFPALENAQVTAETRRAALDRLAARAARDANTSLR